MAESDGIGYKKIHFKNLNLEKMKKVEVIMNDLIEDLVISYMIRC